MVIISHTVKQRRNKLDDYSGEKFVTLSLVTINEIFFSGDDCSRFDRGWASEKS